MRGDILINIRNNTNINNYLKYHSYWYKELIRNPNIFNKLEEEMKKEYKLTINDKIGKFSERIKLVRTFLEVLK